MTNCSAAVVAATDKKNTPRSSDLLAYDDRSGATENGHANSRFVDAVVVIIAVTRQWDVVRVPPLKLEFHGTDADTDILADFRARIVARMSACPATSLSCLPRPTRTRILADLSDRRDFPREDVR